MGGASVGYSTLALRQEAAHPSGPVIVASSAGCLAQIATGAQTLAIWRRSAPEGQSEWLDGLPASQLPEGQFVTAPGGATAPLQRLADGVALPPSPQRDWLIGDIAMLVDCFAQIARCAAVNVRLEAIDHDACWRFHRDYVGLRLNATYRGPGTQWLPPERAEAALLVGDAAPGDFVCRVGRPVTYWFGVVEGLLKMSSDNAQGQTMTFTGVPPGGWFGEGTAMKREPYRYNIQALRKSVVAGLPIDSFHWLLDHSIGFNRFVMNQLKAVEADGVVQQPVK
eukprot:gene1066-1417_t